MKIKIGIYGTTGSDSIDKTFKVYIYTNKINNKKYVGQTCQSLKERAGKDGKGYIGCHVFWNAIQKNGWNNFIPQIVKDNLSKDEANDLEIELIEKYKTTNKQYGYNILKGGSDIQLILIRTHGLSDTQYYYIWDGLKRKCKKNNISLCDEWFDCEKLAGWLISNNYKEGMYIHRIDIGKGYSPDNCFLSTNKESPTYSKTYILKGKTNTLSGWCDYYHINIKIVRDRLNNGMELYEALTKPIKKPKKYEYNGQYKTLNAWAKILPISYSKLYNLIHHENMSIEEALKVSKYERVSKENKMQERLVVV